MNNKTGDVVLTVEDVGAETPSGAQQKADQAEANAKSYADNVAATAASSALSAANSYTDQEIEALAREGNTKTVKEVSDELETHLQDEAAHNGVVGRVGNVEYNVYQLMLQNYYDGKNPEKKIVF